MAAAGAVLEVPAEYVSRHRARHPDSGRVEVEVGHEVTGMKGGGLEVEGDERLGHIESGEAVEEQLFEPGAVGGDHPDDYE